RSRSTRSRQGSSPRPRSGRSAWRPIRRSTAPGSPRSRWAARAPSPRWPQRSATWPPTTQVGPPARSSRSTAGPCWAGADSCPPGDAAGPDPRGTPACGVRRAAVNRSVAGELLPERGQRLVGRQGAGGLRGGGGLGAGTVAGGGGLLPCAALGVGLGGSGDLGAVRLPALVRLGVLL